MVSSGHENLFPGERQQVEIRALGDPMDKFKHNHNSSLKDDMDERSEYRQVLDWIGLALTLLSIISAIEHIIGHGVRPWP